VQPEQDSDRLRPTTNRPGIAAFEGFASRSVDSRTRGEC
jgi:hypothetical protein